MEVKAQAAGGGGGSDIVVEPASGIQSESVASGGSLADVTFDDFTGDTGDIASYELTKVNVAGSATMTGTGLGAYAVASEADGEVLAARLDAKDSSGNILASRFYVGHVAAAGPTVSGELDLTTDVNAASLTYPGTDEVIYEADATTPKALWNSAQEAVSGGISVATQVTASDGVELEVTNASGSYAGAWGCVEVAEPSGFGTELTLLEVLFEVDASLATNNAIALYVSNVPDSRGVSSGYAYRFQLKNLSGNPVWRGQPGDNGTLDSSRSDQGAGVVSASATVCLGILFGPGGYTGICYIEERSSFWGSVPTVGSGVYADHQGPGGASGSPSTTLFGGTLYVGAEVFDYGSSTTATARYLGHQFTSVGL